MFPDLLLKWSKKDGFLKNQTPERPIAGVFLFGAGLGPLKIKKLQPQKL
jgi:hypothetical protein